MTLRTENPAQGAPERAGLSGGLLSGIFLAVVVAGLLVAWLEPASTGATAAPGEPAPALAFTTFDGETFDMVEHFQGDGGPVLLNLWASWCEPCKREFPLLSEFAEAHPEVTVVGVAVQDEEDSARAFIGEADPRFIVGWDRDGSIRDSYPTFGLPATFVISQKGVLTDVILAELTPERLQSIDFGA